MKQKTIGLTPRKFGRRISGFAIAMSILLSGIPAPVQTEAASKESVYVLYKVEQYNMNDSTKKFESKPSATGTYTYDKNGILKKYKSQAKENGSKIVTASTFTYNDKGAVTKSVTESAVDGKTEYKETWKHKLNKDNNPKSTVITGTDSEGKYKTTISYTYKNSTIKKSVYNYTRDNVKVEHNYSFNKNGRLTTDKFKVTSGSTGSGSYSFKFDKKGYPTKCEVKSSDSNYTVKYKNTYKENRLTESILNYVGYGKVKYVFKYKKISVPKKNVAYVNYNSEVRSLTWLFEDATWGTCDDIWLE